MRSSVRGTFRHYHRKTAEGEALVISFARMFTDIRVKVPVNVAFGLELISFW